MRHGPIFPATRGKPILLLHAGNHKTGTTALQQWLFSSPACLADRGILYPREACEHWQHRPLVQAALRDDWRSIAYFLNSIADQAQAQHLILSSEWVQFLSEPQTTALRDAIVAAFPHHDVSCLLYVRRQDEFFDSFYNQEVKYGLFADDFFEFFAKHRRMGDYDGQATLWTSLLGAQHIFVRVYDRIAMPGGDTIGDFCAAAGLEDEGWRPKRDENRSLPADLFLLKRMMNRFITIRSDDYLRALAAILSDVSNDVPQGAIVATTRMERAFVMDQFALANRRLFNTWFDGVDVFRSNQDRLPVLPINSDLSRETLTSLLVHLTQYFEHTIKNR